MKQVQYSDLYSYDHSRFSQQNNNYRYLQFTGQVLTAGEHGHQAPGERPAHMPLHTAGVNGTLSFSSFLYESLPRSQEAQAQSDLMGQGTAEAGLPGGFLLVKQKAPRTLAPWGLGNKPALSLH